MVVVLSLPALASITADQGHALTSTGGGAAGFFARSLVPPKGKELEPKWQRRGGWVDCYIYMGRCVTRWDCAKIVGCGAPRCSFVVADGLRLPIGAT